MNFRSRERAIDFPSEVFPTPGGPTKQRIGPLLSGASFRTARNSRIRSLGFSRPWWSSSRIVRARASSRLSWEKTPQGRPVIQSRNVRIIAVSAESGLLRSSRLSCLSTSSRASGGRDLPSSFLRYCSTSSATSSVTPSSCWIALSCCLRKYSRWLLSISPRAMPEISCWTVRTRISRRRISRTAFSRSTPGRVSRIFCASSSFRSRFEAARSARRAGSSRPAATSMTSGEIVLPRPTAFSRPSFTARRSASTSSVEECAASGSGILTALARSDGLSWTYPSTRTRERPWTRRRIRPSGSLSIRITAAAVPVS